MCLINIRTEVEQNRLIAELPVDDDGYITLWKVFDLEACTQLVAQFNNYSFQKGKNTAKGEIINNFQGKEAEIQYTPGFHCFLRKEEARDWVTTSYNLRGCKRKVLSVKVKKEWITSIGFQEGLVAVCKHIIIEEEDSCV